ncbi:MULTISPECIES: helix-turn-helix domain-containing protein [Sulfurimonas]|uniref:helix-turn-helix domain-containing protein n=1 Tax=Sulfurimonas TaxID=202746 RepID=UPI00125F0C89|nr:helix-turn-helix domain-containing protein [Sulfurimonas hydrogeniphila]
MNIKPIKNEQNYNEALQRIENLMSAKPNTPEMDELEVLTTLVEAYEEKHYKIEAPDPIEAIKFRMEQEGLKQKDLVSIVGSKSRVSEILNKKRKLTIEMIRNLHKQLHIPVESLFLDYKTNCA